VLLPAAVFLIEFFAFLYLREGSAMNGSAWWPLPFGGLWSVILGGVLRLVPRKIGRVLFAAVYLCAVVYSVGQTGYYLLFSEMMWLSEFRYASEGADYLDVLTNYPLSWFLWVIGLVVLGILLVWRYPKYKGNWIPRISAAILVSAAVVGALWLPQAVFQNDEDIRYAVASRVGCFVVDNADELIALNAEAGKAGIRQNILLRVTPGIDPHTYDAVNTGCVDSKFGAAIETGQAMEFVRLALSMEHLFLEGLHCHVGSMVFEEDVYQRTLDIMLSFLSEIRSSCGCTLQTLDIGGGYGVRYLESDPEIDIPARIAEVADYLKQRCAELELPVPYFIMEPGRSIVADAGMTLYTVGTHKHIPGYKTYVSVDGGMTDNPRFALYGSPYTLLTVKEPEGEEELASVVGRCCESGDIIQENVSVPVNISRGDFIACLTTGAYNYSMASNYNRIPRPPVVRLSENGEKLAVRRESFEDLLRLEV